VENDRLHRITIKQSQKWGCFFYYKTDCKKEADVADKKKRQTVFKIDRSDLGMNITNSTLINFCEQEKKCEFFKKQASFGLCKNPHCYLSLQYNLRYKEEGYEWQDMYFDLGESCFCFENADVFKKCTHKNRPISLCRKVCSSFPKPLGQNFE